jgi:hypothetical protein
MLLHLHSKRFFSENKYWLNSLILMTRRINGRKERTALNCITENKEM